MDSRTSSILINLDLKNLTKGLVADKYSSTKESIEQSQIGGKVKSYNNLRSTLRECYFVGSLKYGNNFVM